MIFESDKRKLYILGGGLSVLAMVVIFFAPYLFNVLDGELAPDEGLRASDIQTDREIALTFIGGLVAVFALYVSFIRSRANTRQAEVAERTHSAELVARAIEHLGNEKLEVKLFGLHSIRQLVEVELLESTALVSIVTAYLRQRFIEIKSSESTLQFLEDVQVAIDALASESIAKASEAIDPYKRRLVGLRCGPEYDFRGDFFRVIFERCNLPNMDFSNANLRDAKFLTCQVDGADFDHLQMGGIRMELTSAKDARFVDSSLNDSRFFNCNLTKADFSYCDLREVSFMGSILNAARLIGADLRGADFSNTQGLETVVANGAWLDAETKLPEGSILGGALRTYVRLLHKGKIVALFRRLKKIRSELFLWNGRSYDEDFQTWIVDDQESSEREITFEHFDAISEEKITARAYVVLKDGTQQTMFDVAGPGRSIQTLRLKIAKQKLRM